MISGGRTKLLDIFCRVTGFTSDFLSFIVVELIWFFHGAIQLSNLKSNHNTSAQNSSGAAGGEELVHAIIEWCYRNFIIIIILF